MSDDQKSIDGAEQIKGFREFLKTFNEVSEICFVNCIWDFTTRNVKPQEIKCIMNCTQKYLKMNQRIGTRFQEHQMAVNESALAEARKSGKIPVDNVNF